MGAFYISPSHIPIPLKVYQIFKKKGFDDPIEINDFGLSLLLFKKQLIDTVNLINKYKTSLFIVGTCFYKNESYENGLYNILEDYKDGKFNPNKLIGSYFLLFHHNNRLKFYSDRASVQNIFFHEPSCIISSSFLACVAGTAHHSGKLNLNRKAILEVLITGNLIGPHTLVEKIWRYEPSIRGDLPSIERVTKIHESNDDSIENSRTFHEEIASQLSVLREYFSGLKKNFNTFGVASGLTGGFDSRLLFLVLKHTTNNFILYSTSRPRPTKEFLLAQKLTMESGNILHTQKHLAPERMTSNKFFELLEHNLYFNDGLVRTHQLWTEEIKSSSYLVDLYSGYKIGLSGVGGEQYRNSEYLIKSKYSFIKWYFYENVYRYCKDPFTNKSEKKEWLLHVKEKVAALLKISSEDEYISHYFIKKYYNEIYNPANRVVRNNIENQLHFFCSPFTEYSISEYAYNAFCHLGKHHNFQKEMILALAPELAHVAMDYGYAIKDNVPFVYIANPYLKSLLGFKNYFKIYNFRKGKGQALNNLIESHPEIINYVGIIENLNLPISLSNVKESDRLSPLIIEAGFLLDRIKDYVSYD